MEGKRRNPVTKELSNSAAAMTRRSFLLRAGLISLGAAMSPALFGPVTGCSSVVPSKDVKMGIVFGNQILWRYLAHKKDTLLKPLGYNVTFSEYLDEFQMINDFFADKIDVCATLANALPTLSGSSETQMFSPIAWMKWGYTIVAPAGSSLGSVSDLQGKRVAYFGPSHPSTVYWQAFTMENYGFDLREEVQLVSYDQLPTGNPTAVLADSSFDAAIVESHALSALLPKGSFRQIGDLRAEWNKISKSERLLVYGGYVAKTKWLETNRGVVEDLLRIHYEGLKGYKSDRANLIDAATAYASPNAPEMTKETSAYVADYLGYDDVEPERAYLTSADVEDYETIYSLFVKSGHLKSPPRDVGRLFYLSDKRPT